MMIIIFIFYADTDNEKKFYLSNETMAWPEAQNHCRTHYTDLVSGLNQLQNSMLTRLITSQNDALIFGLFRDGWAWSDDRTFSFRHWNISFFDNQQPTKNCAKIMLNEKGTWKTDDCKAEKSFFCYKGDNWKYIKLKFIV